MQKRDFWVVTGQIKKRLIRVYLLLLPLLVCSCVTGGFNYTKPAQRTYDPNSVTVNMSKDELWKGLIPILGKQFFVINNLDKDSGFINLSYPGDPEQYVDCGVLTSTVSNARGERTYTIPGNKAQKEYEVTLNHPLYFVRTRMQ